MTPEKGEHDHDFENLLYEVENRIATVTLNRPDRLNALQYHPGGLHEEIALAIERAGSDPEVHCVLVTGAGRAFSSGADLGPGNPSTPEEWYAFLGHQDRVNQRIHESRKPVIGALNGICYGAALIMALHFDFLVAAESAKLGFIETRFGATGVETMLYTVGPQWAYFLALTGEMITAAKAREIGLVVETIPDADFRERVTDLARRVASMPVPALYNNRRMVRAGLLGMGWAHQKEMARALNSLTNLSSDEIITADGKDLWKELREHGVKAFVEARDAPFKPPWLEG